MPTVKKYGWKPDIPDHRDFVLKAVSPTVLAALPPKVDMRDVMPPVFDQGDLGSCTANATAGQVWSLDKTDPIQPSRLFIYYNTRAIEHTVGYDSGASIRDSIKSVVKFGFAPESLCPYDVSRFKKKPPAAAYKKALTERVTNYARVVQNAAGIKGVLAQGHTVNFGFTVYDSFEGDDIAANGMMAMPGKGEKVLGGHAVLIVGYDDTIGRYIVRNSWSDGWGDKGYFYMPYEFVHSSKYADDFWVINAVP